MSYGQNTQVFNAKKFKKVEKDIGSQRKQLEELRLQDESQNTRLLKIQQKERIIDNEYKDRKKKMEDTMEVLGFDAEKFNEDQKRMNQDLESKKDVVVMTNDRKKKQEEDRLTREQKQNLIREKEIEEAKQQRDKLEEELLELNEKIDQYRQYESFLKKVLQLSEDFQPEEREGENGVKQIIDRYETLKQKEKDFKNERDKIETEKDDVNKEITKVNQIIFVEIVQIRKQIEEETLGFNSKYNDLKIKIDELNTQNRKLESEIEGKLNENNSKQTEFAQIIMAIKNLYSTIKQRQVYHKIIIYNKDEESHNGQAQPVQDDIRTNNAIIIEKLNYIRDRMRYLVEIKEGWQSHCKEKGISAHFQHN